MFQTPRGCPSPADAHTLMRKFVQNRSHQLGNRHFKATGSLSELVRAIPVKHKTIVRDIDCIESFLRLPPDKKDWSHLVFYQTYRLTLAQSYDMAKFPFDNQSCAINLLMRDYNFSFCQIPTSPSFVQHKSPANDRSSFMAFGFGRRCTEYATEWQIYGPKFARRNIGYLGESIVGHTLKVTGRAVEWRDCVFTNCKCKSSHVATHLFLSVEGNSFKGQFFCNRKPYYYIWNVLFPAFLLCLCGLMSFKISLDDLPDRINLTVAVLFTFFALKFSVAEDLPRLGSSSSSPKNPSWYKCVYKYAHDTARCKSLYRLRYKSNKSLYRLRL